ncbi:MAG: DUF3786 domain-containing protein [Proteobacteria bacterium]|nr:DUF3786 domain-containing protein [Pseudomonadota bacterium]MBU1687666.1 DUF3786 domain-containing protein [Pseudomonadota bacterium]
MNPLEIVRRTPKSNCGECGFPTCLAFGAAVSATGTDPKRCPYLNLDNLEIEPVSINLEDPTRQRDLALVEHLKGKIADLNFKTLAPLLGATLVGIAPDTLTFPFLGQKVLLSKTGILLDKQEPEDPRDQILLYNYIASGGGRLLGGNWVGLESLPNSISKVRTLSVYSEAPLARLLVDAGRSEHLRNAIRLAGGIEQDSISASQTYLFHVLPMVPQQVLFWAEEPEDGFEAKVKILFDQHVLDFLDIESLVFASERLAERLTALVKEPYP